MRIKKVNELRSEESFHIPTRQENALRGKIDAMMVYYIQNQYKIDLNDMKKSGTLGDDNFNEFYREIIEVLEKHKR
jgi:hypothetical protein